MPYTYDRRAAVKQLNLDWLEGLRADFLTLFKNLPRVIDYKTADKLRNAFKMYRKNFEELFFEHFLNRDLKYNSGLDEDIVKWIDGKLRGPAWQFAAELSLPMSYPDGYRSEEGVYRQFLEAAPKWKTRAQGKARVFWQAVREVLEYQQSRQQSGFQVTVPDVDQTEIEGFKLVVRGYTGDERDAEALEKLKEGLKIYRQRAAQTIPLLLKKQLPVKVEFESTLDKGGTYNHNLITFYASSTISNGPKWVAHVMAHEMGHHLWKTFLSDGARKFWSTAISGDYGDLDIQELVDNWPGDAWAWEFPKIVGSIDPILALQVDAISHDPSYTSGPVELQKKEDFQRLLDRGQRTLRVPKTPISGYANKSPEEAFCEAIGLLVAQGPRAVHEKVKWWLDVILPGAFKLATIVRLTPDGDYVLQPWRAYSDMEWKDKIPGGLADKKKPSDFDRGALEKGLKVEMEHTNNPQIALEIAMDHLTESKTYYDDLEKIEKHAKKEPAMNELVRRVVARSLEAMKKPSEDTAKQVIDVLKRAASKYGQFFEANDVKASPNYDLKAKGGYDWLKVALYSTDKGVRYYFTISISKDGKIREIYPEIRKLRSDDTLEKGKKHTSGELEPELLGDPAKMFDRPR